MAESKTKPFAWATLGFAIGVIGMAITYGADRQRLSTNEREILNLQTEQTETRKAIASLQTEMARMGSNVEQIKLILQRLEKQQ